MDNKELAKQIISRITNLYIFWDKQSKIESETEDVLITIEQSRGKIITLNANGAYTKFYYQEGDNISIDEKLEKRIFNFLEKFNPTAEKKENKGCIHVGGAMSFNMPHYFDQNLIIDEKQVIEMQELKPYMGFTEPTRTDSFVGIDTSKIKSLEQNSPYEFERYVLDRVLSKKISRLNYDCTVQDLQEIDSIISTIERLK